MAANYLTAADVAKRLSVKPKTVRSWIKRGELRALRFGRLYRIPEDAVDEMAEAVEVGETVATLRRRKERDVTREKILALRALTGRKR